MEEERLWEPEDWGVGSEISHLGMSEAAPIESYQYDSLNRSSTRTTTDMLMWTGMGVKVRGQGPTLYK